MNANTTSQILNPAAIVALQFEEDTYTMLRNAGVSEARIDAMRAAAHRAARDAAIAQMPTISVEKVAVEWRGLNSLIAAEVK